MRNILAFLAALVVCHAAYPAELFGTVDALSGNAFISDKSGSSEVVSVGLKVYEGQTIRSGSDGEVHVVTEDGGFIAVRPNTVFRVDEYKAEGNSGDKVFTSLLKGAVRSITGWIGKHNASAYRLTTPNATIGIRGTDHETAVIDNGDGDEPGTYDTVNEGATVVKTPQGQTDVIPGKFAFASRNRTGAPIFLAQQPRFLARRSLKVEGRIQQRKEFLRGRHEQMREERIKRIKANQVERFKQVKEQRGGTHERSGGQAIGKERTSGKLREIRGNRLEQARQRREEKKNGQREDREQRRMHAERQ